MNEFKKLKTQKSNSSTTKHHQYLGMANNQRYKFPVIFILFGQIVFLPNHIEAIKWDNGHTFNLPNAIDAISSHNNWTEENHECLIELNAIKNGIESNEKWVTKCEYLPMHFSRASNHRIFLTKFTFYAFSCRFVGRRIVWDSKWTSSRIRIILRLLSYRTKWNKISNSILHWAINKEQHDNV